MPHRRTVYISGRHIGVVRRVPRGPRRRDWLLPLALVALFGLGSGSLWCAVFMPVVTDDEASTPALRLPLASIASSDGAAAASEPPPPAAPALSPEAESLLAAATQQLEAKVRYSADYFQIPYPMGDVPAEVGTSADLLVRALRGAGIDLQQAIQEDREAAPEGYPTKRWKRVRPDRNVDHRRLANIKAWLDRHADCRTTRIHPEALGDYQPGDIVMWSLRDGRVSPDHAGIVSEEKNAEGAPLVIDLHPEVGRVARQHPVDKWGVRGHYRLPRPEAGRLDASPAVAAEAASTDTAAR